VRELVGMTEPAAPDFQVTMRPLDADADAQAVHGLNEASFSSNPDYQPEPFAGFDQEHLRAHDLDPGLSCVAEHDGILVGFLLARRWESGGVAFVDLLGVHPDYKGHGLGTAMLMGAFVRFAAAGLREAQLGVASDNPRALGLYERCGMTPRFRFDTYERPILSSSHR
jgi:ribosomal protein S18 acetylase RimI-like enzyme